MPIELKSLNTADSTRDVDPATRARHTIQRVGDVADVPPEHVVRQLVAEEPSDLGDLSAGHRLPSAAGRREHGDVDVGVATDLGIDANEPIELAEISDLLGQLAFRGLAQGLAVINHAAR